MSETSSWLYNYIKNKSGLADLDEHADFFSKGYLDSLDVLTLVAEIEKEFEITIDSEYFIDRRFPTIIGLSEIISEIQSAT